MKDYTKFQRIKKELHCGVARGGEALVLMAKAPLPGCAKTRLIPRLGKEGAARLAECMLLDRLESLRKVSVRRFLAFSPDAARGYFRETGRRAYRLFSQGRGSLGERLTRIARKLMEQGFARIVFVGADSPLMRLSVIRQAFRELRRGMDMVISPAQDGGYTLIGISRFFPEIFQEIPWGGQAVFKTTLFRARRLHLKIGILPAGFDVDVPQDLEKLKRSLRRRRASSSKRVFDFLTQLRGL